MKTPRGGVPAGLAAGVIGAHVLFFHGIPVFWPAALLLVLAGAFRAAVPAALAIGLALAEQGLEAHRADRLEPSLAGARLTVTGIIDGLPEAYDTYTRFRFRPASHTHNQASPPAGRIIIHGSHPRLSSVHSNVSQGDVIRRSDDNRLVCCSRLNENTK